MLFGFVAVGVSDVVHDDDDDDDDDEDDDICDVVVVSIGLHLPLIWAVLL